MKTAEEYLQEAAENLGFNSAHDMIWVGEPEFVEQVVLSRMEEYAEQFKPKWIDVKDRLPEPFVRVFVIDYDSCCFIDFISDDENIFSNESWVNYTHWQPLPSCPA